MSRCAGITRAGTACKGKPIDGSEWCYYHPPDHVEERKRHGSKGGKRGGRGRPKVDVGAIKQQLQGLADGVLDGSVGRAEAAVASQILNVLLRAITVELQIKEQAEHDERITALEEKARQRELVKHGNGQF
jgi:hypothetical protein